METIAETLGNSCFGQHVGKEIVRQVAAGGRLERFPAEETIFRLGEPSAALYTVQEGQVKLVRSGPGYREHIIHLAERYHMFGEASLFLPGHPVTAVTVTPASVVVIPREHLQSVMSREPRLQAYFLEVLAAWLNELIEKIDQLTLLDGAQRLARFLLERLEDTESAGAESESPVVQIPTRKRELATMLNLNPPSLSRILRQLQEQGLIRVRGRRIELLDRQGLRAMTRLPVFHDVRRAFAMP